MIHKPLRIRTTEADLGIPEALALLEQRPYAPIKLNFFQRLEKLERLSRSPTSVFALKTAAATSVFSVLILNSAPRPWFLSFGLTSGALTIVTALSPTLYVKILILYSVY